MNIFQVLKLQNKILTTAEIRRFKFIAAIFLIASLFDIFGIGAISYFLLIMVQPSMMAHLPVIGHVFPSTWGSQRILIVLGSTILILFLLKTIIGCCSQKILIEYCYKVGARIRSELMDHYLYAPYSYFIEHHTSDVINQILMYVNNYTGLNLAPLMLFIVHSIFITSVLIFLCISHPTMTLMIIVMLGGSLVLNIQLSKEKLHQVGLKINETNQYIVKTVQEAFSGLKEIRILGKEHYFLSHIKAVADENAKAYGFAAVFQKLPLYFIESVTFTFVILLCLIQLIMDVSPQLIVASCGIILTAAARLLPSVYQVAISVASIHSSNPTLQVIYDNVVQLNNPLQKQRQWPKNNDQVKPLSFSTISLHSICYQYPQAARLALDSISLVLHKGESIGIIGPSGAGKSTLVDVILGLLEPQSGSIRLDGAPIPPNNKWVNYFAYIPQTIYLLDGTIRKNITLEEDDCADINMHQLNEAIQMSQLEEVIRHLPNGIHTVIGENGIRLSGGQRQRIALARTFYHQREIIIMDEATSALDSETEHEIVNAIKRLHHIKTLIIIAHRYSTVEHCDRVYRLVDGKLIEEGSFKSVVLKH